MCFVTRELTCIVIIIAATQDHWDTHSLLAPVLQQGNFHLLRYNKGFMIVFKLYLSLLIMQAETQRFLADHSGSHRRFTGSFYVWFDHPWIAPGRSRKFSHNCLIFAMIEYKTMIRTWFIGHCFWGFVFKNDPCLIRDRDNCIYIYIYTPTHKFIDIYLGVCVVITIAQVWELTENKYTPFLLMPLVI